MCIIKNSLRHNNVLFKYNILKKLNIHIFVNKYINFIIIKQMFGNTILTYPKYFLSNLLLNLINSKNTNIRSTYINIIFVKNIYHMDIYIKDTYIKTSNIMGKNGIF